MAEPLIKCKVSLISWLKKTWATVFSWGLPAETERISISTASVHSHFIKTMEQSGRSCFSTFPCTTWNDGIQLGSEVTLSKALTWLEELTFILNHQVINQITKPQEVHTGHLSELFLNIGRLSFKGNNKWETRGNLLGAENGGRRHLVLQSNSSL